MSLGGRCRSVDQSGQAGVGPRGPTRRRQQGQRAAFRPSSFFIELNPRGPVTGQKRAGDSSYSTWNTALPARMNDCLLYTSDAADEEDSVDLGGRRIIKKKK